jgi:hypothetical protein
MGMINRERRVCNNRASCATAAYYNLLGIVIEGLMTLFGNHTPSIRRALNGAIKAFVIGSLSAVALNLHAAWAAEPLATPKGPVLLSVSGNIEVTNVDDTAAFDREMLKELGVVEVKTSTPWTDGTPVFTGVLARTLLERLGASGSVVLASALNDYTVEIPIEDFLEHDVLLATEMDGKELLVSDKGPVWIIYPRDSDEQLRDRSLHDRWVWQLKSLQVQ